MQSNSSGSKGLLIAGLLGLGAVMVTRSKSAAATRAPSTSAPTTAPAPSAAPVPAATPRDLGASVLLPSGAYLARVQLTDGSYSPAYGGAGGQYMGLVAGLNLSKSGLRAVEVQGAGPWVVVWRA